MLLTRPRRADSIPVRSTSAEDDACSPYANNKASTRETVSKCILSSSYKSFVYEAATLNSLTTLKTPRVMETASCANARPDAAVENGSAIAGTRGMVCMTCIGAIAMIWRLAVATVALGKRLGIRRRRSKKRTGQENSRKMPPIDDKHGLSQTVQWIQKVC